MNAEEIRLDAIRGSFRFRAGPILAVMGMAMIIAAFLIRIVIATVAADYFAYDKAARDAAPAGSSILHDLAVISTWPEWTLPFLFLGVATMMVGIALIFSTIPRRVKLRANAMAAVLPQVVESRGASK